MTEAQRVRLFDRCDGVCERCGERPAAEAHHRFPAGLGGKRDRKAPDSAYEMLCNRCHAGIHGTRVVD